MGKKSRQKARVERGKQKKAAAGAAGDSGEDKALSIGISRRLKELAEAAGGEAAGGGCLQRAR
jgi:hypothetical protein